MTNKDYLFNLDDYELAEHLINISEEHWTYQNNNGTETQSAEKCEVYTDPAGNKWYIYDDAIDATIEWLNSEVE